MALSKKIKYFWGVGELGEGFVNSTFNLFFVFFLTDVTKFPVQYVSFILLFTSIFDFFLVPAGGAIIEGTKAMRWGRLRSWVLLCPFILLATFPLLFIRTETNIGSIAFVIAVYLVFKLFFNIAIASNLTLIPAMTNNRKERAILTSNRMVAAHSGVLLNGYLAPLVLSGFLLVYCREQAYMIIAIFACIVLIAGYLAHFRMSREYVKPEKNNYVNLEKPSKLSLRQMLVVLVHTPRLLTVMFADVASTCVYFVLPTIAVYYYNNVIEQPALLSIHMLVISIGGILGSFNARIFLKYFSARTACLIVYPLITTALLTTRFFVWQPALFIAVNGIMQFFVSTTQPIESNLYMDVAALSKKKTGTDAQAFIISMSNMSSIFSGIIKNLIISVTLVSIGYTAGSTTEAVKRGIIDAYSLVPAIFPVLGWMVMFFFYKSTPEKLKVKNG
jgi:GPH family glycoside/pentoside/hexuronide:cation symporter